MARCRECFHADDERHAFDCSQRPRVGCSNCGGEFFIAGRTSGFSHCDSHSQYTPIPD